MCAATWQFGGRSSADFIRDCKGRERNQLWWNAHSADSSELWVWLNQTPLELSLPGGTPETASLGKVAFCAVTQQPGKAFQPGGEEMTSLAEAIHLALPQECWDNFQRWQDKDKCERGLPFSNPVLTAIRSSSLILYWNWRLQKLHF